MNPESAIAQAALVIVAGFCLGYLNGSNDVSKGVATLVGARVTMYRHAIAWGAVWTGFGTFGAFVLARRITVTFGAEILDPATKPSFTVGVATIFGAAAWVLLSTRWGFPVSTSHAVLGALAAAACVAHGVASVQWNELITMVGVPMVAGPVIALLGTSLLAGLVKERKSPSLMELSQREVESRIGNVSMDSERAQQLLHHGSNRSSLDLFHWLTSGITSFVRGFSVAPRFVALLLAAGALFKEKLVSQEAAFAAIGFGIVAGSFIMGIRITRVLAEEVTPMTRGQGFMANFVTAGLVTGGSFLGFPFSATYVSSAAIMGVGLARGGRSLNSQTVVRIIAGWLLTLPGAALTGMIVYEILRILI